MFYENIGLQTKS